ncbi:TM2 domain-containing protein [Rhodobacter aestuarii]|uniref:TM2 domain-containing protein n=1 Tax=Rhodobacter aestuarii TaxID=453582 RepID=A0A1N7M5C1_9RHOB|nr:MULTISPECIES: TM2 domain-containing protein [Rhodobacter]PTV94858.1 TM2 domain-containing protein [Rhodobacter aestuarii]SIS81315.1 TM2 domain-containing protein [Rhodobacter aestuarii]SOC14114.1 TM2 domain-containing protein [Rhodobacter sp. JA431]
MTDRALWIEQRIANDGPSTLVAYLLWFFLGFFGVHRFYLGRWFSGLMQLVLFGIGSALTFILVGYIPLALVGLWWALDALLIPGMIATDRAVMRYRLMNGWD